MPPKPSLHRRHYCASLIAEGEAQKILASTSVVNALSSKRGSVWRSHFALANSSSFAIQHSATSHTIIRWPVENFIRKYFY
jgi:hypothetical protein